MQLVQQRIATPEQVDRICRMAGGFRMGPFELMDLVGLDVALAVSRSFYEQSFGEPRWRPSMLQARLVAAGRLGRKSGRGWYEASAGRPRDPEPPEPGGGDGRVVEIRGDGAVARALAERAAAAGWQVGADGAKLVVDAGPGWRPAPARVPRVALCDRAPLAELDPRGRGAGFFALAPLGRAVELTTQPTTDPRAEAAARAFFATLGMHVEPVGDAPGLVLGRIVAQLVNEAAFAVRDGAGSEADIDLGMELGLNHPRGPLTWGDLAGPGAVLAILDGLRREYGDDRYRAAPLLRERVRSGSPLRISAPATPAPASP